MSDCQLFTSRDERKEDEDILASCWVECCSGDTHERAHWENFCQSLKDVIVATGHSLDAPKLYKIDRDTGQTSLKVIWAPIPGWREHVDSSAWLPTFHNGYPCTTASVMDGKKVQVWFTLRYGPAMCEEPYLHTALISISTDDQHTAAECL
ncbi:hypothetical protein PILCRDRAFT_2692 [Piloderma croceum F 1598]|uniref:Uncharacterized protein n=1 Tax=Piloderma croceum (strain F 1598) TaxID=765440 RepID=A0A0C3BSH4_PILCF|nr:hypothetical protein PILCRDRAFT_2692 [Piloderma croceum F 1598]